MYGDKPDTPHDIFRKNLNDCSYTCEKSPNELTKLWGAILREFGNIESQLKLSDDDSFYDEGQMVVETIRAIPEFERAIYALRAFVSPYVIASHEAIMDLARKNEEEPDRRITDPDEELKRRKESAS